ncbi:MAG: F-box protein [Alphaproteobacteria bacterium]|nr:F-box protein [Alphaproteobacteria bacterium]NCQ66948.1 F-box protein [Alphaproteobacteria bacterium]NCT07514.1 F-box protein [Alphaproteobacteria bacterium]
MNKKLFTFFIFIISTLSANSSSFEEIPPEVQVKIVQHIDNKEDLLNLSLVSWSMNVVARDPYIWKNFSIGVMFSFDMPEGFPSFVTKTHETVEISEDRLKFLKENENWWVVTRALREKVRSGFLTLPIVLDTIKGGCMDSFKSRMNLMAGISENSFDYGKSYALVEAYAFLRSGSEDFQVVNERMMDDNTLKGCIDGLLSIIVENSNNIDSIKNMISYFCSNQEIDFLEENISRYLSTLPVTY